MYDAAAADDEGFWASQAHELLDWSTDWHTILEWELPFAKWFVGGRLNVSHNCLDRHVTAGHGDRVAIHWEGEPGDTRTVTYAELHAEVQRLANALKGLGVAKGDRVNIYLPMVPEAVVAMLACARIGAPHSVVFGGFSAEALADRIDDAEAKLLITADGGYRRGEVFPLKPAADEAVAASSTIEHVVVVSAAATTSRWSTGATTGTTTSSRPPTPTARPSRWTPRTCCSCCTRRARRASPRASCTPPAATSPTSPTPTSTSSTSTPTTDVYWCTADVGWVTGHSYIVYGPLANGATTVMYEGVPNFPDNDRFWAIVEKYGVTVLYTAPTAIRTFMKWGAEEPAKHDLSSLRVLGSVGEPINPEAWMWYHEHIGGGTCPVVDTWWQTETGGIMISPLARGDHHQARFGHVPAARRVGRGRRRRGRRGDPRWRATSRSPGPGRACCAASGAMPSATSRRTGADIPAATSPATAPSSTTTATTGCSAGSTT